MAETEHEYTADQRNLFAAERTVFAAERTLLAWNRTSLALMGFGFVIDRFGLYVQILETAATAERLSSFWIGISFIVLGSAIVFFQCSAIERSLGHLISSTS